jgi:hypothetical protein
MIFSNVCTFCVVTRAENHSFRLFLSNFTGDRKLAGQSNRVERTADAVRGRGRGGLAEYQGRGFTNQAVVAQRRRHGHTTAVQHQVSHSDR